MRQPRAGTVGPMDVEVRDVADDERAEWNRVLDTAFLRPVRDQAADEAYWARHPTAPERSSHQLGAFSGGCLVGTAHVFPTSVSLPGGADLAVEGLSGVGVLPTHRRRGALTALMATTLRGAADRSAAASVLIAAEYPIYGRFGYGPATESTAWEIRVPSRFRQPVPEGTTELVDAGRAAQARPRPLRRDADAATGQPRARRPRLGFAHGSRPDAVARPLAGQLHRAAHPAGRPTGYATYHVERASDGRRPDSTLHVDDLVATSPEASAALWRACCEVDWVRTVRAADRPVDEIVPYLLVDGRQARQVARDDFMWLRVLDPVAVLGGRRSLADRRVVIEVLDEAGFAGGRYELDGQGCRRSRRAADLTVPVEALGAVALGGPAVRALAAAGWLQEDRAGALDDADALLHWPVAPWCATWF